MAWNAILRATTADQFFIDAPIPTFPISWQDTGSLVFAVAKSLHVLAVIDDEELRRDIKGTRNLQEVRHALAEKVFHGRKGQLFR